MNNKNALFLILICLFGWSVTYAQTAVLNSTISGALQPGGDFFGDHVTADDDWIIVGAPREDVDLDGDGVINPALGELDTGAIYIFQRTAAGPVLFQRIVGEANNLVAATPGDRFGAGVTLLGDTLMVGAANDDNFPGLVDPTPNPAQNFFFAGQVYVFNFDANANQWVLVQKLISDNPNTLAAFGSRTDSAHIELFGFGNGQPRIALIGEPENGATQPATLHVFQRKNNQSTWSRIQVAGSPNGAGGGFFADKIQRAGKFALVTEAIIAPPLAPEMVHAYRINPNGIVKFNNQLIPVQTLLPPGGPSVGTCISVFGDGMSSADGVAVISDPCDSTAAPQGGAVHVYDVGNGNNNPLTLNQTLFSPAPVAGEFFGGNFANGKQNIATDGDLIAVGTNQIGVAIAPQQVQLYARDAGGVFNLTDSITSPNIVVPMFDVYGQSVSFIGDDQLAISQMGLAFPGGQVFVFDVQ